MILSVYLRSLIFLLATLILACDSSNLTFHMMYYTYKLNKQGDNVQSWHTPFPILNQFIVSCLVLTCFLTHIQVSQETGLVFPSVQVFSIVCCNLKGFSIVSEADIDVFLELPCFLCDPKNVGNLVFGSSAFSPLLWFAFSLGYLDFGLRIF